jgi:iron uptake system component EfeO
VNPRRRAGLVALVLSLLLPACSGGDDDLVLADAARDAAAAAAAKQLLAGYAHDLHAAALTLQAAAPDAGWTSASDPSSVAAMKAAWKDARRAYQGLEGAADRSFPDLDAAIDTRYDDQIALGPDPDPFDGQGFVGLHAVERILWSDEVPASVIAFESGLAGYVAPSFPTTATQAAEFKGGLCGRLVSDTAALELRVDGLALDSPSAYQAALGLVHIQVIKVEEAGAGKDESRYSRSTLADMRANMAAAEATHAVFRGWLLAKQGGPAVDGEVGAGFARLASAYTAVHGDGLPFAPAGWSSIAPTDTMLGSPFGALFQATSAECDDTRDGSLAHAMGEAVELLGIAPLAPDAAPPVARPHDAT